jgi:hypothetical protein
MSEIEEKVSATIKYLIGENITPSISKVCKYAEISRANLYTTYPHLINQIKSFRVKKDSDKPKNSEATSLVEENKKLKFQLKVLGYTCIELRHALDREKDKSQQLTFRLEKLKK